MTAVLLGMTWLDAFDSNADAQPHTASLLKLNKTRVRKRSLWPQA